MSEFLYPTTGKQTLIDNSNASEMYVGSAMCGVPTSAPAWEIIQIKTTPALLQSVKYPNGCIDGNFVWDDRATLVYK